MSSTTVTPSATARPLSCIQIDLAPLHLAVPIDRVEKVVRPSDIVGEDIAGEGLIEEGMIGENLSALGQHGHDDASAAGAVSSGIVYYANRAVTLLNLQRHFQQVPAPTTYFLILRATSGELVAIPIPHAPNLIEFPAPALKQLPPTYRRVNLLGIASHVARTSEGPTTFILDVDYLVNRWG